ncbi:hypothetical protein [[Clostridium] dakarense]|uniref:hypothetical protein n=1 Tax=Faecalimicrobium dakarense TaxID=1301100 RepID=UPI0004B5ED44|nr:hypothetical protein [[Clostridium] dakarense]
MTLSIIILIVGVLGVVLGGIVRKYKMGYLVQWVNLKKYDNDKVADIMGAHVIVLGICLIAIASVNYVLKNTYQDIIVITMVLSGIAIELGGYYRIYKYAKLEN